MPLLGSKPIADVAADDLRAVVEALDETVRREALHWNTARKIWGLVTKLFSDSVRSKIATLRVRKDNPARDVQGPDEGEPTAKQWLYPDEVSALLACPEVPVRWRRLYALATYLYLRPGELAALEWKDVELSSGYVHIHQALDQRTGKAKATKTGVTRKVPIPPALRPLLAFLRGDGTPAGRVVQSDSAKRGEAAKAHGMPPLEDLAATLREHLLRAGVDRAELHEERRTTKRVTFYDLRSTGITWEVLARTEHLKIQQRAGHKSFSTTQGYIRTAEELGASIGAPFPALPDSLLAIGPLHGPEGGPQSDSRNEIEGDSRGKARRPQRDLNPCYSLERAVSWAG
jgi:integrase